MDPRKLFVDERLKGVCCYCGNSPETRDHVPSRVFLDEPYPPNLPVVGACRVCNESFSQDEEYVACLIECVICGTTNPKSVKRNKIQRILSESPLLASRIQESCIADEIGNIYWSPDANRIKNVVLKLARGHLAFELNIYHFEEPDVLDVKPIATMSNTEYETFENTPEHVFYPEIGSRAFISMSKHPQENWRSWHDVQTQRYRYRIEQGKDGDMVQFVLSEYLACKAIWV